MPCPQILNILILTDKVQAFWLLYPSSMPNSQSSYEKDDKITFSYSNGHPGEPLSPAPCFVSSLNAAQWCWYNVASDDTYLILIYMEITCGKLLLKK